MIKKIIHTVMASVALTAWLVSCSTDEWQGGLSPADAPEGYVALRFNAAFPAMQEVVTRAVDPDGAGVQDMTLFCFDAYGLFITRVAATLTPTDELSGTFDAEVPENTRTIHFVSNQNMTEFQEDNFRNKSEHEVMAVLEGSPGRMIYWARFACNPANTTDNIKVQMAAAGNSIEMIRNHARISIDNPTNTWLVVTGYVAYNTNAFGTVAPYHPVNGFNFVWPSNSDPFVTLARNDAKLSDITDVVDVSTSQYVYESENRSEDPVSVILRGHLPGDPTEKYYRVLILDQDGEQLLIRRNHHYKLHIAGTLSYGQNTFAEATVAAATNNVWISISDDVNEVEDQNYILTVEKTAYVLDESFAGDTYTIHYTLTGKGGTTVQLSDKPDVTWIDNNVASQVLTNNFSVVGGVGEGTIYITLLSMGSNEQLSGTLLVKKGKLQRKIKVITIKEQSFEPAWVSTQVYGYINPSNPTVNRSHVTLVFTVPETCPEALFPMQVLISVNNLDVRNASGMKLSVIREGDEGYGDPNGIGYKYVYTVEKPGVQRVYFENILDQANGYSDQVKIEAEYFESLTRTFTFSTDQKSITVEGLSYMSGSSTPNYADDENIYYLMVPQKQHANIGFDLQLTNNGVDFNPTAHDEFLLFTQYLDYSAGGDCTFYPIESSAWWPVNNPEGGRMLMFQPNSLTPTNTGQYAVNMYTTRAKSEEVLRVASNLPSYPPVLAANGSGGLYDGNSYRSFIFEIINYNPFRFAARVNGSGSDTSGDQAEAVTPLTWTYEPDRPVTIEIDVTSFQATDGNSVDPFGQEFEIYIDAPMLQIDASRLAACNINATKLKAHPTIAGRFIYTVDANRATERIFGTGVALLTDASGANQIGERKTLPFINNSIVSAGNIVISSNEEQVVFFSKTFAVSNQSITGTLQYRDASSVLHDVPLNAFVSFERELNGTRIGSIAMSSGGQYELRLRKEYTFNWYTDPIVVEYSDQGIVYTARYANLATLFANPNIELD
ncbi:MAG: hypothetical protein LBR48_04215 [Dysgonamonadaceae bacterium]|nr:hypothetical protein [Dysgonamonadaceae bacterium]